MEPKPQDNYLKKYDEKSLDKLQSKVVFNDPAFLFIFKKTEKVTAALYLITNLISDSEPIKLQIRQISLKILSDTLSFKSVNSTQSKSVVADLVARISETISLLKIASLANLISTMNHAVVHKELVLLLNNLDELNLESLTSGGLVLPQEFFNVPEPTFSVSPTRTSAISPTIFPKGQYKTMSGLKDSKGQQTSQGQNTQTTIQKDILKDTRRETITRLLKAGKPLGIKDFALQIKDCSEKTIQRELIDMVAKGVLKKTGERRWSVYSLL